MQYSRTFHWVVCHSFLYTLMVFFLFTPSVIFKAYISLILQHFPEIQHCILFSFLDRRTSLLIFYDVRVLSNFRE